MKTSTNNRSVFLVYLGEEIHSIANFFCQQQDNFTGAERVYLDTLAVYAVNEWLRSRSIETDWEDRIRGNSLALSGANSAVLIVKERGKLACYPVQPDEDCIEIESEIFSDRIGYVFVAIDAEMSTAKLLGGIREISHSRLLIGQLWALDVFRDYLTGNPWKLDFE